MIPHLAKMQLYVTISAIRSFLRPKITFHNSRASVNILIKEFQNKFSAVDFFNELVNTPFFSDSLYENVFLIHKDLCVKFITVEKNEFKL